MAKPVKDVYIGGRVTKAYAAKVGEYATASEANVAEIMRKALDEYMANHPIKQPTKPVSLKPGEE